ncbi:MAG: S8 family serine peptidase [Planctomycetota bacterium]
MFQTLILLALPLAQSGQEAPQSTLQWVDTGFDRALFEIEDTTASLTTASRINDDHMSKLGMIPAPTPGYELTSTVIVETDAVADLAKIANSIAESWIEPLTAAPGFQLVHAANVGDALLLARDLEAYFGDEAVYLDAKRPWAERALPSDPNFGSQWHLKNNINSIADVNVEGAWNNGFTGNGVVIGIIDGGIYVNHPDLNANYNATASLGSGVSNHGTSCAGVAAAVEGNGQGGVGAAYGAQFSMMRYGNSSTTSASFGHRNDINDIKSNSWGPIDDGTISYMTSAERTAMENAVSGGRAGLGEIFCWAAGNGGLADRVEYDPYASSRMTIAVGAIGDNDTRAFYNEHGSSMTVVAPSSGNNRGIFTTTGGSGYTSSFGGTSSASPLAAGVTALVLQANPALTWRDVQAVLIESARKNDPNNANWLVNGAGYDVSLNYGFGAVDADAATQLAQTWTNLGPEQMTTSGVVAVNQSIPDNNTTGLSRTVTIPVDFVVESVELKMNVSHNNVGDLYIKINSPNGIGSIVAKQRGDTTNNYNNFIFTSMRHWGESSLGDWTIDVQDQSAGTTGTWTNFTLTIYGHDGTGAAMTLSSPSVVGGNSATFSVSNATPSATTWLAYSTTGLGSFGIPALGVTLGIASPSQLGAAQVANALGAADFVVSVPSGATGFSYWMQTIQAGQVSNIISGTVL